MILHDLRHLLRVNLRKKIVFQSDKEKKNQLYSLIVSPLCLQFKITTKCY